MGRVATRTPPIAPAVVLGFLAVLALGVFAYDRANRDRLADGVRIDGIPVGGLSSAAATSRLQRTVAGTMERPILVRGHGHSFRITPRQAGVVVDLAATVSAALDASRGGSIFTRTWRGVTGGRVKADVPLRVSYSHQALAQFVQRVRAAVDTEPVDASVQPTAGGLRQVPDRPGAAVEQKRLTARVAQALTAPGGARTVALPVIERRPAVTTAELAARYPAYIVVDREAFRLLFYQHLKLADSYEIAVGMQGLETQPGLYHVQWKQVNPPWYVPNSAWAGALAGKTIPPGPEDPLKARFMAFNGGAGIHGIDPSEYGTIGHDASHGCVRMRIPDVIALYARTPVGTPVYVL
jgi:lipoprotein-anchoring transpeptidase ErfK/SrfK